MSGPWEQYKPQESSSGPWEQFGASPAKETAEPLKIGKAGFQDALRQTLESAGWGARNLAGMGSAAVSAWEGVKGIAGKTDPEQLANQRIIAESAPVGNIAGNVAMFAPTAAIPGANSLAGSALIGGVTNALTTPGSAQERFLAGGMGAAGGAAGVKLAGAMGGIKPSQANPNIALLQQAGVHLTPGQGAGGFLKSLEDKATSVPVLGNIINKSRLEGIEDFNKAVMKRATLPGMNVEGVGREAIQDLRVGLGEAYESLLPKLTFKPDKQFLADLTNLRDLASQLPGKVGMHGKPINPFEQIIDRELIKRMTPQGNMSGESLKTAESEIGRLAAGYRSDPAFENRQLGDALAELQDLIRQNLMRNNPKYAEELSTINKAYANFKRIQRAAAGVGAEEGVFTPAQLNAAVKAMDKSKDKRAFSEGTAMLQDLSSSGKAVMPSKVPDSGTAGRLMGNIFSLGGLTSTIGGAAAALPAYAAYSRSGSAVLNSLAGLPGPTRNALLKMLSENPDLLRTVGSAAPKFVGQ